MIESWQFDPRQIAKMDLANVHSVGLSPDRETLESRIRGDAGFYRDAWDEETTISHYVERSVRHREEIIRAARELDLPVVPVTDQTTPEDLEALVIATLNGITVAASPRQSKPAHLS